MTSSPRILAIETSCDETAVAVAEGTRRILLSEVASQIDLHSPYGGVVPELASRNHNLTLKPILERVLEKLEFTIADIDAIAATSGPGLASSLLIGDTTGKAIALAAGIPFWSINHMEGHLLSPFIDTESGLRPNLSLVVSGGHTMIVKVNAVGDYEILGATRDDAAGEAFDKAGKMLGLPYPGGPVIDQRSERGNPEAFDFPRAMRKSGDFAFSFSGMKTAMSHRIASLGENWDPENESLVDDLCASFQAAIVEVLVEKTIAAATSEECDLLTVSGGVSCNRGLRKAMEEAAREKGIELLLATPWLFDGQRRDDRLRRRLPAGGGFCTFGFFAQDINPNLGLGGTASV